MRLRIPERGERGAIAIMTAVLMTVLLAVAALAVDITTQVNVRQKLFDTVDAAAQAGAYRLPSSGPTAASDARASFAANNGPVATPPVVPTVGLFCVVASKLVSGSYAVDTSQIPATCNPVSAGGVYTVSSTLKCNSKICGIPCNGANDVCNTIKVTGRKSVPFSFAPAIGITAPGTTGSVSSAACKGVCGTVPINPMDVAVVADRTPSMDSTDITAMINGIKGMFQEMTPSQQYVALGSIHRSATLYHSTAACNSTYKGLTWPSTSLTDGQWMPVDFSNNYLTGTNINTADPLVKGVNCLTNQSSTTVATHLASPLKSAARYLLGAPTYDRNNLTLLPARTGTIRKAIIFETDGEPRESAPTGGNTLLTSGDVFSKTDRTMTIGSGTATRYYYNGGHMACENMKDVAAKAKLEGVLVVTIAYNLSGQNCDSYDTSYDGTRDCKTLANACRYSVYATPTKLTDALASSASPAASGATPSNATADGNYNNNNNCASAGDRALENGDGDYFFCAASGTVMAPIFKTVITQIANGIRLIQLP